MKTRRLVKALRRVHLQPGDMLLVAPPVDMYRLAAAARILARHRPELKGTPIIRAWPHEIAAKPRAEGAP